MDVNNNTSTPLGVISPSKYQWLRRCPRHIALTPQPARRPAGAPRIQAGAAGVGTFVHRVLELMVAEGGWALDEAVSAATVELPDVQANGADKSARRRAVLRLRKAVVELQALVEEAGASPSDMRPEEPLASSDGLVRGTADLLIRGPSSTTLVDYKAGVVQSTDGPPVIDADHVAQLQLYAALEHEVNGRWPTRAVLLSLRQGVVAVEIDPVDCQRALDAARQALLEYDTRAPGPQPGAPASETCRWCSVSPSCDCYWADVDPTWVGVPARHSIRGLVVSEPEKSENGLSAVEVEIHAGTWTGHRVQLARLQISDLHPGDQISVVGLSGDEEGAAVLTPSASCRMAVQAADQV